MTVLRRVTGLIVCSCLMWATPAIADPSTVNTIAADTIHRWTSARAAPLLDFAMVHAAITTPFKRMKNGSALCGPYWRRHRLAGSYRCPSLARRVVNRFSTPAQVAAIHARPRFLASHH